MELRWEQIRQIPILRVLTLRQSNLQGEKQAYTAVITLKCCQVNFIKSHETWCILLTHVRSPKWQIRNFLHPVSIVLNWFVPHPFLKMENRELLGSSYMVSGTRDNPSPKASLSSAYENVVPVGRVKVNPAWLFITLIEKSNVQIFLFLWVSLSHPITVCFAELSFTSLIRISALNPKSRHYVTLAKARAVPGRRAKEFIWRKVVPLARVTLPAEFSRRTFWFQSRTSHALPRIKLLRFTDSVWCQTTTLNNSFRQ